MHKVLYLIDSLQTGGAEKSLVTIASKLKRIQPIFVYVYNGNLLEKKLRENDIEVFSLNIKREYNFRDAVERLLPIVNKVRPDIIHSTLFNSDIIARKLKKQYPVLLINSFVNNSYNTDRYKNISWINKAKLFAFQLYDRVTASNVDFFISNSEAIKGTNAAALHIPHNKIKVIHRGRELDRYLNVPKHTVKNLKRELDLQEETIFLNVGRLLERKGQMDLLISFKELLKTNANLKLLIAGEGSFEGKLRNFIHKNRMEKKVLLLGNRNDIPELLNFANFFVFPSWFEGLPGSLIEAMMAGTPLIASNIPENLECITEEGALYFKKGNTGDLLEKMQWALKNRSSMREKAKYAQGVAENKFDISLIVEEYEKTYLDLIKNNSIFQSESSL